MDNSPTPNGFTLVELIIVIIILGIISTFAASRFVGTSSYSTFTAQEQAISVIRQIQVNRMQSNVSAASDSFRLAINSDCLGSVTACSLNLSNSAQKHRPMHVVIMCVNQIFHFLQRILLSTLIYWEILQ